LLDTVAIAGAVAGLIVVGFVVVAIIVHRRRTADQASESMFTPLQSATGAPTVRLEHHRDPSAALE
jgi:hypothetical protein